MKLERFAGALPDSIGPGYRRFEAEFRYPLGPSHSFRIEHEGGAHRFFASMGQASCAVVSDEAGVCGSGAAAIRRLLLPDGSERRVAYFGDLRVSARARGGACLFRVVRDLESWARGRAAEGLAIAMDGTARTPLDYTGRARIPRFDALGRIAVWLIETGRWTREPVEARTAPMEDIHAAFRALSAGRYALLSGSPASRSSIQPEGLLLGDGKACGFLEDTRLAKRLILDGGVEILGAHLSAFAFESPRSGGAILRSALSAASQRGFDRLFVAVAAQDAAGLRDEVAGAPLLEAPATVYGAGLEGGFPWNVNTSEI